MANRSPLILIAYELEDLDPEDVERFRTQMRTPRGDGVVPDCFRRGQVAGKTCQQLADLLVDSFAHNAVPVTVRLFKALNLAQAAINLEEKTKDLSGPKEQKPDVPPAPAAGGAPGAAALKGHFVDRHRIQLVDRVSNIGPILDYLLQKKVLQSEQYDKVTDIRPKQDQMRFLFKEPLKSGGDRSKDVLLSALEEHELYLIQELRETEG